MRITPSILQGEFIGLKAEVVRSPHPNHTGIAGRVINETRNTLVILHKGEKKVVAKDVAVFHFTMPDGTIVEIDGKALMGRPEDRVKKRIKRRW